MRLTVAHDRTRIHAKEFSAFKERDVPMVKVPWPERDCIQCRKPFVPTRSDKKYCSPECRDAYWAKAREIGLKAMRAEDQIQP